MLDHRERVVEVVEQPPPLLVLGRAAEALRVVLQPRPLDEEFDVEAPAEADIIDLDNLQG